MRNAFGFLPCRYECGSVPFSPSIFFFFFLVGVGGNYLNCFNFYCTTGLFLLHSLLQECWEGRDPCAEHEKQKAD